MPTYTDQSLFNISVGPITTLLNLIGSTANVKYSIFQATFTTNGTGDALSLHKVVVEGTTTNTYQVMGTTNFGTNTSYSPSQLFNMTLEQNQSLVAVTTGTGNVDAVASGKLIQG